MSSEDTKTLVYQYQKSDKTSYIAYADLESLIKRIDVCQNNFGKLSTTKEGEYILY